MTDKVQKIREEVERLMYGFNLEADIASCEDAGTEKLADIKYQLCKKILHYIDSLQEEPIILTEEMLKKNGFLLNPRPRYNPSYWSKLFTASDGREYLCKINMEHKIREILMTVMPLASNDGSGQPTCYLPHPKTIQQLEKSLRLFNIKYVIEV